MVWQKLLERKCISLCRRFGVPLSLVVLMCERDLRKRQKLLKNYKLRWRSFFVGNRVVIKVPPHRKFRQRDKDIHRHFSWTTILWHKFNGINLQIAEYLSQKKAKKLKLKQERRKNRKSSKREKLVVLNESSSDDVQLIDTQRDNPIIDLESDDDVPMAQEEQNQEITEEQSEPEEVHPVLAFPKIVSVASAGTVVDGFGEFEEAPPPEDEAPKPNSEPQDEMKPTNEELERARLIFSNMEPETGADIKEDICNALYSLDNLSAEAQGIPQGSEKNFLRSLANKMGVDDDAAVMQSIKEKAFDDCYQELEQTFKHVKDVASKMEDVVVKDEDTSSSTEFLGFNENDLLTPGLLKTPMVRQAGSYSAFVSKKGNSLLKKLGPIAVDRDEKFFFNRYDEGKMNKFSKPPKLECPELPLDMKPRTLAEKKQLMRMKPVGYQVMDQENSVYQLLKKRLKAPLDDKLFDQAQRIMQQIVPMRRNVWQTATWLNTRENHYIYRYISHKGRVIKLFGCMGNYRMKHVVPLYDRLPPRVLKPKPRPFCCRVAGFPPGVKFTNILRQREREKANEGREKKGDQCPMSPIKRKWNLIEARKIPAGPLCTKPKNSDKDENLAPLDVFALPQVLLQLWPRNNETFPLKVKRYLNEMCPYEELTEEWINFALATLTDAPKRKEPIVFEIPYENDRRKILVSRDVHPGAARRTRTTEVYDDTEPLTFRKDLPDDELLEECADILEDMVDSVAIGMAEDHFSAIDPDLDYGTHDSDKRFLQAPKDQEAPSFKRPRSSALLAELKRLNATIINTENIQSRQKCNNDHCKQGCICDSISSLSYPTGHCEKVRCMFECICQKALLINNTNTNPFSKEVFRMRDKAISRLARGEKDFSSTVVLTNNNTFLLSNSSEEKSKRNRTVPRKFGDYVRTETGDNDADAGDSPGKVPGVRGPAKRRKRNVDPEIERMRHVCVVATQIGGIVGDMEPWCMTHELYRCFCNGDTIQGNPFLLTQVGSSQIALSAEIVDTPTSKKQRKTMEGDSQRDLSLTVAENQDSPNAPTLTTFQISEFLSPGVDMDQDDAMIEDYLRNIHKARVKKYKRGETTAHIFKGSVSRCIPFDKSTQVVLNKQNAKRVKKFIYAMERTPEILNLLKVRYTESVSKTRKEIQKKIMQQSGSHMKRHTKDYPVRAPKVGVEFVESSQEDYSEAVRSLDSSNFSDAARSLDSSTYSVDALHSVKVSTDQESNKVDPVIPVISSVTSLSQSTEVSSSSFGDIPVMQETEMRKSLLDKLNLMVSQMMTTISKTEEKLTLDAPMANKITTIKWINLIQGYRSYKLHIWEAHYHGTVYLLITRSNQKPEFGPFPQVCELRKLQQANTQFGRMLAATYNLKNIDKIAALLFGHKDYWQVMGFLDKGDKRYNASSKYLSVSKETHPEVASKISQLYSFLLGKVTTTRTKIPVSNVQLMSAEQIRDAKLLKFPLPSQSGQRWFMLVITNDFSDISHPKWGMLLSYDRIHHAIQIAEKNGRTVQVKSNNSITLNPSVYAIPAQMDKIFIGPYGLQEECDIVLYQRMDGSILLRETYEKVSNVKRTTKTMGCWIQLKEESDVSSDSMVQNGDVPQSSPVKKPDEDCIIVEADATQIKAAEEAHEAENAVNSILPDGLKLPTEQPKKLMRSVEEQPEVGRIRVISDHLLTARSSPALSESSNDSGPPHKRRRPASQKSDSDVSDLVNLKEVTVIPMDEATPEWTAPTTNLPVLTITSEKVPDAPTSSFPVISKVVSLNEDANKAHEQQSLLKINNITSDAPTEPATEKESTQPIIRGPHFKKVYTMKRIESPSLRILEPIASTSAEIPKITPVVSRQVRIVKSINPVAAKLSTGIMPSTTSTIPAPAVRVAYTTSGKKILIQRMPPKDVPEGALKRSPPPLILPAKKPKVSDAEPDTSMPIKVNSLLPNNNPIQIGQTLLQKVTNPATTAVVKAVADGRAKFVPGLFYNDQGNQVMKVKWSGKAPPIKPIQLFTKPPTTSPIIVPSSVAVKVPAAASSTLLDSSKTITITRTTSDGKAMKFVLPVSSITPIKPIYSLPTKVPVLPQSIPSTSKQMAPTIMEKSPEDAASTSLETGDTESPVENDIIDLLDDEEELMRKKFSVPRENITNGWIVPSVPQLGYIKARMVDNTNYFMELPTRRHPFKVGCNCIDRYMDRYMKYCVAMYLPEDLSVRWEFSETKPPGENFTLQSSSNKDRLVLTPNGVMDMEFPVLRELIDCPSVYTRLLLVHLEYVCSGSLKSTKGFEVVDNAVEILKDLTLEESQLQTELKNEKDKQRSLLQLITTIPVNKDDDNEAPTDNN